MKKALLLALLLTAAMPQVTLTYNKRDNNLVIGAGVVLAVLGIGGGMYYYNQQNQPATKTEPKVTVNPPAPANNSNQQPTNSQPPLENPDAKLYEALQKKQEQAARRQRLEAERKKQAEEEEKRTRELQQKAHERSAEIERNWQRQEYQQRKLVEKIYADQKPF